MAYMLGHLDKLGLGLVKHFDRSSVDYSKLHLVVNLICKLILTVE